MTRAAAMLSLFLAVSPGVAAIRGRVVGGGKAVANAKIVAYAVETAPETLARAVANRPRAVLAATQSAPDGTFTLPLEGNGAVVVRFDAAGFAPSSTEEVLGDANVLIGLGAKHAHEYTLRSPDGPLAGARVVALLGDGAVVETATDDGGKLTLDGDGAATMLAIHPRAALHMSALQPNERVVELERGVPLKGKVVDARGDGVAGAKISIDFVPVAVSAADGSFTIERAPRSYAQITAEAGDLGGTAAASVGEAVIRVAPRIAVTGVARDAEKRPLRGVSLVLGNEYSSNVAGSDEKGAFAFHVAPGTYARGNTDATYHVDMAAVEVRKALVKDIVATHTPMLAGIVTKTDGTPVDGAQIVLAVEAAGEESAMLERIGGAAMFPRSTTGPDGRFRIAALPFPPPAQSSVVPPGKPPRDFSIVMGAGTDDVSGTVKDPSGHAVAGVAVVPLPAGRVVFGTFDDALLTDGEGRFTTPLSKGDWRMTFAKDGYLPHDIAVTAPAKSMAVELTPASSIRGRVVRKSGDGVEGVVIFDETNHAMTAADGSFTLSGGRAGEHVLQYMMMSGQHGELRVTAPAADARIVLEDGGIVRGRVVDAAGAPVMSYEVTMTRSSDNNVFSPRRIMDEEGRFVVNDAPVGEATVSVKAKGFMPASQSGIVVEAGKATDEIVLTLSRGRSVRGKFVSAAGEPLTDVNVALDGFEETVVTNADGTFEVSGLSTKPTSLSFRKSGFITSVQKVPGGDADAHVDVQLRPGLTVSGRVLAPGGEPLPDAQVNASTSTPGVESSMVPTNENGEFRFDDLSPARYTLAVGGGYDSSAEIPEGSVKDVDVEHVHEVTIRTKMPVHGTIYGEVAGNDLAGKEITINVNGGDRWAQGRSDGAGKYRIAKAPVGTVTVQASIDTGGGPKRWTRQVVVEVPPRGEVRADLRFDDTFPIAGRVLRGGPPMTAATVTFTDADGNQFSALTGEGGTYHTAVAAGHYTVGVGNYSVAHDVAGPATIDINVELTKVTVAVVDAATSAPLAGAAVSGRDSTSSTHAAVTGATGSSGQVTLELPPSVSDIVVEKDGYATAVAAAAPPVGRKLMRCDGVNVRVVDARDGRPLSGYAIARDANGRVLASANEAGPDGTINFPLPPGHYRFSASASEYGSHTVAADVPGPDVLIPLRPGGKLLLQSHADVHADARLIEPGGEEYVRCWCNGIADIRINGRTTLIDSVAPGSYTLEILQTGAKPRKIPVSVIQGDTVTVSLDP